MKDRIVLLIKVKNLTAAQFADEIGVQKSSISHIISGRNNASLDFIQKILLRYPEVNMNWILFGKGSIFKEVDMGSSPFEDRQLPESKELVSSSVDLFSVLKTESSFDFSKENEFKITSEEQAFPKKDDTEKNDTRIENEKRVSNEQKMIHPNQEIVIPDLRNTSTKSIIKIVEFYSDNTYRVYLPEN